MLSQKSFILVLGVLLLFSFSFAYEDHADYIEETMESGQDVTEACLSCHEDAASEVMQTIHWTWKDNAKAVPGHKGKHAIGKLNAFNNYWRWSHRSVS